MTFYLGPKSKKNMAGLHPALALMAPKALALSPVDWGFTEPLVRTVAQQRQKVKDGVSKTMNSPHLVRSDGYGHAVDCVPYIDGAYTWGDAKRFGWPVDILGVETFPIFHIAAAWRLACIAGQFPMTWGGVWDRDIRSLPPGWEGMREAMLAYNARHPGADFNDGPHFEMRNAQ